MRKGTHYGGNFSLGMGIDQSNVRQVIHVALPESICYQEARRAVA